MTVGRGLGRAANTAALDPVARSEWTRAYIASS